MRALFLFVLALNVAYIGWQLTATNGEPQLQQARSSNTNSIVLLGEIREETREESAVVTKGRSVSEDMALSEAADTGNEPKPKSEPESEPGPEPGLTDSAKAGRTELAADVAPVDTEESVSDDGATSAGDTRVSVKGSCFTIGPFAKLDDLRRYVRDIRPYVVEANFRDLEEKRRSVYWVYIKPAKNRKAARALGKQLRANKIKDYYIIREGAKLNGISLGHFKSKKRANRQAKKVEKLGFDVVVEPLFKTYTLYWLDYQLAEDKKVPEDIDSKYIASGNSDSAAGSGSSGITRLSRDCGVSGKH